MLQLGGVIVYHIILEYLVGVRQGRIMSPYCFNCYIDLLIQALKETGFGCWFRRDYAGCILFAHDILLLFASVSKLWGMLSLCYEFLIQWELLFNCKKFHVCYILILLCLLHVNWS